MLHKMSTVTVSEIVWFRKSELRVKFRIAVSACSESSLTWPTALCAGDRV